MRGKTLGDLLTSLRIEISASVNPAGNVQVRDMQIGRLQRTQEILWEDYSWPHLRVERYFSPEIGQRYFDTAGLLDIDGNITGDVLVDRVNEISLRDGSIWRPLYAGISQEHYNAYDSDTDQRAWPPRRWALREDEQIEVWPIPDQAGDAVNRINLLKVVGTRNLASLINDSDRADLDDRLIVLYAAAEMLSGANAAMKMKLADKRLFKLRGNLQKLKKFRMFGDQKPERILRGPPTVYYRTTP